MSLTFYILKLLVLPLHYKNNPNLSFLSKGQPTSLINLSLPTIRMLSASPCSRQPGDGNGKLAWMGPPPSFFPCVGTWDGGQSHHLTFFRLTSPSLHRSQGGSAHRVKFFTVHKLNLSEHIKSRIQ